MEAHTSSYIDSRDFFRSNGYLVTILSQVGVDSAFVVLSHVTKTPSSTCSLVIAITVHSTRVMVLEAFNY